MASLLARGGVSLLLARTRPAAAASPAGRLATPLAAAGAAIIHPPPHAARRSAARRISVSAVISAGHSKWAKVKRAKGANDQKRGALFSKHAAAIKSAALSGDALRLQSAVDKAKRDNTPAHVIDKARDVSARGEAMEEILYEGIGPCSTGVLVECLTTNRVRAAKWVRSVFNKFGGDFQSSGSVSWQFTTRGRFTLPYGGGEGGAGLEAAQEAILEAAMAAEAEDVEFPDPDPEGDEGEGGEGAGRRVAYVYCDPAKLGTVRNALVGGGLTPSVSEVLRIPQSTVDIPPGEDAEQFGTFLEMLEELEDVQAVYHNAASEE